MEQKSGHASIPLADFVRNEIPHDVCSRSMCECVYWDYVVFFIDITGFFKKLFIYFPGASLNWITTRFACVFLLLLYLQTYMRTKSPSGDIYIHFT